MVFLVLLLMMLFYLDSHAQTELPNATLQLSLHDQEAKLHGRKQHMKKLVRLPRLNCWISPHGRCKLLFLASPCDFLLFKLCERICWFRLLVLSGTMSPAGGVLFLFSEDHHSTILGEKLHSRKTWALSPMGVNIVLSCTLCYPWGFQFNQP